MIGTVLVGIGLGFMIDAGFGVAPLDAFFTGISYRTGLSVGVILFLLSGLMVLLSWALGLKPAVGTLITFVGIAILVDVTRLVGDAIGAPEWPIAVRVVWWMLGLVLFGSGVLGIFACDLGASPYDQLVRAISFRTGRSLGFARIVLDAITLLTAIVLGGSWASAPSSSCSSYHSRSTACSRSSSRTCIVIPRTTEQPERLRLRQIHA